MPFSIYFGPQPDKFLKKLDNLTKDRIKNKLLKLKDDLFLKK